jgi:hypothetical protein
MRAPWGVAVLLVLAVALRGAGAAPPEDRLARVGELGRLLSGDPLAPGDGEALLAEIFALADAEVLDSLRSGGPFASAAFIQERLDAFTATWGGAGFRVAPLGRAGEAPLILGVWSVAGAAPRGSVRAWGPGPGGEARLLAAVEHEGAPEIHAWPPARDGSAQVLVTWLGAGSGGGGRPLQIEVWRRGGRDGLDRVWSAATLFPGGLWALGFSVKGAEVSIRYEPRYPGWKPGCERQTEHVDLYRPDARGDALVLARRQVVNGWHRELQATVERFLAALASRHQATLAELVPDRALRGRLPRTLAAEPACDQGSPDAAPGVAVAATEERDGRMVPWSLSWRRAPRGWRLSAAAPMLQ